MRVIKLIIKRNIVRTFRNKSTVMIVTLMSLLPAIMLLVLGDMWMIPVLTSVVDDIDVAWAILRANILAITISVVAFTAPVSILGLVSEDFENKTIHNFLTAPIKKSYISYSYILSGVIFGFIIILFVMVVGQGFLLVTGDGLLSIFTLVKLLMLSILILTSLSTVFFYIMSGVKSVQTAGAMTGLIGGFSPILGGVYIQLSMFPELVATIINLLPFSHVLAIFKRVMLLPLVDKYELSNEVKDTLFEIQTVDLKMFGIIVSPVASIFIIIGCMMVFGGLSILRFKKLKRK